MLKRVAVAAGLCVAVMLAAIPNAIAGHHHHHHHHHHKAKTQLVGTGTFEDGNGFRVVEGQVKSSRKACEDKRKVTLYLSAEGKDQPLGSARARKNRFSDGRYLWDVYVDQPSTVQAYAKVKQNRRCKSAKSKTIDVPVGDPDRPVSP